MTRFLDGPAEGQALGLRRSPVFLRVVHNPVSQAAPFKNDWDALDMLDDEPRGGERVYVYELVAQQGHVHINRGRHGSGFFAMASYKLLAGEQPSEEVLRDTQRWRDWCRAEVERRNMPDVIDPTKE